MATFRASALGGATTGTGNRTVTITPAVGDLLLVFVNVSANTNDAPTCSDDQGGTYTLVSVAPRGASAHRLACFVRDALMTNTTSTVITAETGSNSAGSVVAVAVTGMARTGAEAIRQSAKEDNAAAGTPAPAFPAAALTANLTLGAVGNADNPAGITHPADWLEREDTGQANPSTGLEVVTRDSGFTGTTVTWGGASATDFASMIVELDDSVVPTDPPPAGGTVLRAAALPAILLAWQIAVAPPAPQPQPVRHVPIIEAAVVDNPPFGQRPNNVYTIQRAWPQRDYGRPATSSGDEAQPPPADQPLGGRAPRADILRAWEPPSPATQRRVSLVQGAVVADAPPVGAPRSLIQSTILGAWSPGPPAPQWGRHVPAATPSVDDPPRRGLVSLPQILAAWQPAAPRPETPRRVVETAVVADPPPFGARTRQQQLATILRAWPDRGYGRPAASSGDEAAAPADTPPFGLNRQSVSILRAWEAPAAPPPRPLRSVQAAPADDPPWDAKDRSTRSLIVALWQPAAPQPWIPRHVPPESVPSDDPPFGAKPQPALEHWQVQAPTPVLPRHIVQPFVAAADDPPFGRRVSLPTILRAWSWRPVGSTSGDSAQPPAQVDDPPFGASRWQQTAAARWVPRTAVPLWSGALSQPFVPDDPPFGLRTPLWSVLHAWQPGPPKPWVPRYVVQGTVVVADSPPFGLPPDWLPAVLRAWQPGPWGAQSARTVAPGIISIDAPPVGYRPWLALALAAWRPGDPLPTLPRHLVQPAVVAADAPPAGRRPLASLLAAWQAPAGLPQRGGLIAHLAGSVDDPPFGVRRPGVAWPPAVIWSPARHGIAPFVIVVDDPPFGLRRELARILGHWTPDAPLVRLARALPQEGPPVPADDPPFGQRDPGAAVWAWWVPGPPPVPTLRHLPGQPDRGLIFVRHERGIIVEVRFETGIIPEARDERGRVGAGG